MRHGFAGTGVVTPDQWVEEVNARYEDWFVTLMPFHDIDAFFVKDIAVNSVFLQNAQRHVVLQAGLAIESAFKDWEDDRRREALELFARLARDPGLNVELLSRFKQGAELLIERWEGLGAALEARGCWTDGQRLLALDMLGVIPELRDGPTPLDAAGGKTELEVRRAVVAEQIGDLRERIEVRLKEKDADDRSAAELGLAEKDTPGLRLARRYATAAARRLISSFALLNRVRQRYIPRDMFSAYQEAKLQEEVAQKIRMEMAGVPVPQYADLTQLRATPPPEPAPAEAPAEAPAIGPIVEPPYPPLPTRAEGPAPPAESAPVADEERKE